MIYKNILFLLTILSFIHQTSYAQNLRLGLPAHEHYEYIMEDFKSADVDKNNTLYISANNSILKFKGYYDELINPANNIGVIEIEENNIFFGGNKRYGELIIDSLDQYSLSDQFTQTESSVTHISSSNYGNFILSKNTVFHFTDKIAKKYTFPGIVDYLSSVNGSTIVHDDTNGLSIFVGGRFKLVNNSRFLSTMKVIAIKSTGPGSYIIATEKNGVYRFDGETFSSFSESYLSAKRILDLEIITNTNGLEEVAIITTDNSFLTFDFSGNLLQDKLFSNELYSLLKDSDNRLYIISKKGIDIFFYNLPFQIVDLSVDPIHGPIVLFNQKLYWGTNNGLYYSRLQETGTLMDARIRVKDTEGKVGKLDIVNETLLMSHEDGLYDILPKIGARFIPDERFFDFEELENDYLLGFSNRRAYLLKKVGRKWRIFDRLDDFPVHPKSIVYSKNNMLWLIDRDYNLLQYKFDAKTRTFDKINSQSNVDKVDIFSLNDELILIKDKKAFSFDGAEFNPSDDLTAIFGNTIDLEQIINDQYGNVWFIQNHKVGIFNSIIDGTKRTYKKLLINYPVEDPRYIYPYDKNNVFINNGDHFVKLDLERYMKSNVDTPKIERIYAKRNGKVINKYIGAVDKSAQQNLSIKIRPEEELHIISSNPLFPESRINYSLTNNEGEVVKINTTKNSNLLFSDLTNTAYTIKLQAEDYRGESQSKTVTVDVRKNFFTTPYFYILLGILNLLIILLAYIFGYRKGKRKSTVSYIN